MNPFTVLAPPLGWLISVFYQVIPNYGVAIIFLTLAVSFALFPLTLKQTRSMKAMQEIQPEIKRLQKEYKHDRQELNQQLMALYQERNVNPAAGCLPLLIQMPVWFALFSVLRTTPTTADDGTVGLSTGYIPENSPLADAILDGKTSFLSMDLSLSPNEVFSAEGFVSVLPYAVLVLVVMASGYYQQWQTTRKRNANETAKTQQQLQQQQGMQAAMKIMPLVFGVISWVWPTGLVLYFAVSNLFRVGQQAVILRLDEETEESKSRETGPAVETERDSAKRSGPSPHASKKRKKRRRK